MDSPAYKAGVGPGMKLVAVNSRRFSPKVMDEALTTAKKHNQSILLLLEDGDFFRTYRIDYRGGAKFARLERLKGQPDWLSKILAPVTGPNEKKTAKSGG
jgi:predicted metalloprotease with PDZ domain